MPAAFVFLLNQVYCQSIVFYAWFCRKKIFLNYSVVKIKQSLDKKKIRRSRLIHFSMLMLKSKEKKQKKIF